MRSSPEFDLLAAIRARMAVTRESHEGAPIAVGIGDDAAVTIPGGAIAVTVDALVEGVGFRRRWCPPRAVGRKALGAALSDLAAMGARAGEAYVWVGAPRGFGDAECLELCAGIAELASEHDVAVLGGDLTEAGELSVCVTAVGHARLADDLLGRDGAEAGFSLCVTGALGGAAAGLMVLEHDELGAEVTPSAREAVVSRQLSPVPRLAAGLALAGSGARAMIDVSDGLGADAEHLAAASGIGIEIELELVPVGDGVREVALAAGRDPIELVASGGEDYELLCAIPRAALAECRAAVAAGGSRLTEIGRFVDGGSVRLRLPGGRSVPVDGHDQRRGR